MSQKRVLFIDDGDLAAIIERLRRLLKNEGMTLVETKLDLNLPKFKVPDPDNVENLLLSFDNIKAELNEFYINEPFDLVACDYHFANDKMDGYQILKWLKNTSTSGRHRLRRARFCLYSSEGDKFAQKTTTVEQVSQLIRVKFDDFLKRENLALELTRLLKLDSGTFNFSKSLIEELEKFPDFGFRGVYTTFTGRSLSEIAHEIDKDSVHGVAFQKELLELTIAHLIELNDIK